MQVRMSVILICAAVLIASLSAATASAPAAQFHAGSTTGPLYTGPITGNTTTSTTFATSWGGTITCQDSHVTGTVASGSASGSITSAAWGTTASTPNLDGECQSSLLGTCGALAQLLWNFSLTSVTTVQFTGTSVNISCGSISCTYGGTVNTGFFNPSGSTPGRITFNNASVAKVSGSFACGSGSMTWNASYDITDGSGGLIFVA